MCLCGHWHQDPQQTASPCMFLLSWSYQTSNGHVLVREILNHPSPHGGGGLARWSASPAEMVGRALNSEWPERALI